MGRRPLRAGRLKVIMNHVAYFFASGDAFHAGTLLALLAVGIGEFRFKQVDVSQPSVRNRLANLLPRWSVFCGLLLIILSAVPLPLWIAASFGPVIVFRVMALRGETQDRKSHVRRASRCLALSLVMAIVVDEWDVRSLNRNRPVPNDSIVVLGDSLSAGMGEPLAHLWPDRLSDRLNVIVTNLAQPGAMVKEAISQARFIPPNNSATVLIEIGGNDLLSGRPAHVFEAELEELLQQLRRADRRLVLLELPLPPFCQSYGRVQRDLARKYGAALIPRRRWAGVIFSDRATVDGLHFSVRGHQRMSEMVGTFLAEIHARPMASTTGIDSHVQ